PSITPVASINLCAFPDVTGNHHNPLSSPTRRTSDLNATISVAPYSVTYDGSAHSATGSATGVLGESLSGLHLSGTMHTNAGAYSDTWTITDVSSNYNNAGGTVSDSIAKANATISVAP